MSMFTQIAELVSSLNSPNSGLNMDCHAALRLPGQMTESDWDHLRQYLVSTSPDWQYRAVNCAAYGDPTFVIPWLIDVLRSARGGVFVRGLELLSEFSPGQMRSYLTVIEVELEPR
jgi:hypothetical protein